MNIAFLLYPQMTCLDLTGPHEVLSRLPGAVGHRVAARPGPIPTDSGIVLHAETTLSDLPAPDLVVVPGALDVSAACDDATLAWLRRAHETATWTMSVCTGSLVLGHAGLLTGRRATTHWAAMEQLRALGAEPVAERVVRDGSILTTAGVSAGIDGALVLTAALMGETVAQALQLGIEYDPAPPFAAGSPKSAPPELVAKVRASIAAAEAARRQPAT
jgi:transcriptional regulator GlxA family with amidase domain